MFFKKKNNENVDKDLYSLAIMTDDEMDEEEFFELSEKIMDQVNNIGVVSHITRNEWYPEQLQMLDQHYSPVSSANPCFIINLIVHEEINEAIKQLEKDHKWKKLFGWLSMSDYMEVEDQAQLNFKNTVYCTDDADKVIEFLNRQPLKR
ncbi:hypothetical protein V7068_08565 [Bacillus sp. JJ634]